MLFLFDTFREQLRLSERDCTLISSHFQFQQLAKREVLLSPGSRCDFMVLVESGVLRTYTYDPQDREFNLMFAYHKQWITDIRAYHSGRAAKMTLEAVDKSKVWIIEREDLEALQDQVPALRGYFSKLSVQTNCELQDRIINSVTLTAKEHYRNLTQEKPHLLRRVPQFHIANYLGITPESLSRIRKELILETAD